MKKRFVVGVSLVLVLFFAAAVIEAAPKLRIGFTPPSFVSPYWTYVLQAAKAEAQKQGVELITTAPKDHTDFEGQIRILEDFVQKKVDVVMMGVVDKAAVVPGQKRVNAAKIPIVILNQIQPQPGNVKIETYIGVDNFEGGALMGEYVRKILKEKGDIALIEGIPGEASNERLEGFFSVKDKFPNMVIIDRQVADWDEGKALTVMENFLESHSKIDVVFGLCDSMALGGITAAKGRGRLKNIIFVGYDGTSEAYASISKGELTATISQTPLELGRIGVISAVKIAQKQKLPLIQKLPAFLVTAENVEEFAAAYKSAN